MPRKRTRHNSRKRSLMFTESPLNASQNYCSPVLGAIHPVTADTVPIDDDLDLCWVSPQFDPNCENTPLRRRRGQRSRAACSAVSSLPSCQPQLKNNTLKAQNVSRYSKKNSKALSRGFTCLKFVGDKEVGQDQSSAAESVSSESAQNQNTNGPSTRSKPKQYGGKPMNCSVNESLNPDEFEVTQNRTCEGNNTMAHQTTNRLNNNNDKKGSSVRIRRSCRLRKQGYDNVSSSPSFHKQSKSHRLLLGTDQMLYPRGRILACDTPEADYGLKVSIRRRKDLLPPAARNKLLCS
ncbi:uncharacterized protein [Amphiura filiformis]|uniref:uncharacterized protein n=1 Tax=Amphiura filiformis TaxID=82378 RepID=UPI003B222ABF